MSNQAQAYSASEITVLEGLEAVRKRPGMYIGNTGQDGLHRCLGEIVDNSVDECMEGHADTIKVVIDNQEHFALVADNGRGIPTDIHPKTGKSALETILTVLHAGGKFDQNNYQYAGGLHGVGASVANALSKKLEVWVLRDNMIHFMQFSKGKTVIEMETFEADQLVVKYPEIINHTVWSKNGTIIKFCPDDEIFETVKFSIKEATEYLKQIAYLNKGLKLIFEDSENTNNLANINLELIDEIEKVEIEDLKNIFK
jgi:DNA gyrase subunit B